MAATARPSSAIALRGAPDSDIGTKDAKHTCVQVMQLDMAQDVVDELLESAKNGKAPQILFGRTPQLKYGDKSRILQTGSESFRYELYQSSGAGSDNELKFIGLINHNLVVQKAEEVTAGADAALEQLRSQMAAISESREANKTIVGNASPAYTPGHRRFNSKSLKPQHFKPDSHVNSPLRSTASSPAMSLSTHMASAPTSQPSGVKPAYLQAIRYATVHLVAAGPHSEESIIHHTRSSQSDVRDILPKIAKRNAANHWQLRDKAFKELDPFNFKYTLDETRQKAIDNAIKAFDRLRLAKDDKLWQILLPVEDRGKGKCLSRLNVQAPAQNPGTALRNFPKAADKKPTTSQKSDRKDGEKDGKKSKGGKEIKEKKPVKGVVDKAAVPKQSTVSKVATASTEKAFASKQSMVSKAATLLVTEPAKPRKQPTGTGAPVSRPRPQTSAKEVPRERGPRPRKPAMPVNTKPKNPSPLSVSPPVNASDFEDGHPVHKALSAAASPAKNSLQYSTNGNSDRILKRKANDLDSNIHEHNMPKQPRREIAKANYPPLSNGRTSAATVTSGNSLKRKAADETSTTNNPPVAKQHKMNGIDTNAAARYHTQKNNGHVSPGDSSSATTSPTVPSLSFRQTVELSRKFEKYYKRYEELHYKLADSPTSPTAEQREALMKMRKKLEEMKREIKTGAGVKH
ncbi:hypothetical protein GQ43DRAFT_273134 [Delitschia confertaspora ATCC 74209]|uniref:Uncharacterized protein n=1 Tax=Delitschia confertaspora ATCC 74209 TaxID=1513339 RepID=A0A9P4JU37_9PLEO|nr:hypothetical protein GQ43DRAFT_273134 [Delitschia confertaspora ATCC 74209]